jgi:hypothetical protein
LTNILRGGRVLDQDGNNESQSGQRR